MPLHCWLRPRLGQRLSSGAAVSCTMEVCRERLLHNYSRHLSGLSRFWTVTFDNCCKNWWMPAHSPTDQGGSRIEFNTHSHTHTTHGAWTQELRKGLLQEKRARTTDQRVLKSIQWFTTSHQICLTVQSPTLQICSCLYTTFSHVSNAEVLARRLIGTCIRRSLFTASHNYSPLTISDDPITCHTFPPGGCHPIDIVMTGWDDWIVQLRPTIPLWWVPFPQN